ncbi:MAG TPA: CAP domain-containing protein [Anaerolineae bacterium]|nr:CAP domain-containing protein [Anaerolineae bacterium]
MNNKVLRLAVAAGAVGVMGVVLAGMMLLLARPSASQVQQAPTPPVAARQVQQPAPTPAALLPLVARGWPPEAPPADGWLQYLNQYRAMSGLPPLAENPEWSAGAALHARYIVKNDVVTHIEDPANAWYTPAGAAAGEASNVMGSTNVDAPDGYAIDTWMQAPFHAVGILDPELATTGFGSYREAGGYLAMGAALDVIRGLETVPATVTFPIYWPGDGETVALSEHRGEYPDPLSSCPGYSVPAGLPLLLQIGPGDLSPTVTDHSLVGNGQPLEHCVFDETTYENPDATLQALGRAVLAARDAIVLIPRLPLSVGTTYTASITVDGVAYTWSFSVAELAPGARSAPAEGVGLNAIPPRPDLWRTP